MLRRFISPPVKKISGVLCFAREYVGSLCTWLKQKGLISSLVFGDFEKSSELTAYGFSNENEHSDSHFLWCTPGQLEKIFTLFDRIENLDTFTCIRVSTVLLNSASFSDGFQPILEAKIGKKVQWKVVEDFYCLTFQLA